MNEGAPMEVTSMSISVVETRGTMMSTTHEGGPRAER